VSNLMEGTAEGQGAGGCRVTLGEFALIAGEGESDTRGASKITIRPERVDLEATGSTGENRVPGMVERVVYVGSILQVFVTLAVLSAIVAAATIWLTLTDPVTVADAVDTGQVSPLVRQLASVLYGALSGLLKYL